VEKRHIDKERDGKRWIETFLIGLHRVESERERDSIEIEIEITE